MLEILSSIIQVISYGYVIVQLRNKKINIKNRKNIVIVFIMVITSYISGMTNVGFSKTIIMYSVFTICYKYIYNISFEKSSILNFLSVSVHCICELIVVIIIKIINVDNNILGKYLYLTPLSGLLVFLIVILLITLFKKQIQNIEKHISDQNNSNIFYIILILFFSILFSINISNWKDDNIKYNIITVTIFGLIILFLFRERYRVIKTNNSFNELFEQSQIVSTLLEKYQKMNHENMNDLRIIKEKTSNNKDVQKYINEILEEKKSVNDQKWIMEVTKIKDIGISGFLSIKINEMSDNGIKVIVVISNRVKNFEFNKLNTKEYKDFCRVLGIYLDNAYEASKNSKEKEVTIEISTIENKLEIIISNTFAGKVDLDRIDTYGYSTKGKEHGTGLSLAKDIIESNHFIKQKRTIIDNYYFQYLYLEKDKNKN